MNTHRFPGPGPAQRAAGEIRTTLNGVAANVHELNGKLAELHSQVTGPAEPTSLVETKNAGSPPDGNAGPMVREPMEQAGAGSPEPAAPAATPPDANGNSAGHAPPGPEPRMALPAVPDPGPQLEAFVNMVVRNQHMMIRQLQNIQPLLLAHTAQLAELHLQLARQQTIIGNLRSF